MPNFSTGHNALAKAIACPVKRPVSDVRYLHRVVRERPWRPPRQYMLLPLLLVAHQSLVVKTLSLQTAHTWVAGQEKSSWCWQLVLPACWRGFTEPTVPCRLLGRTGINSLTQLTLVCSKHILLITNHRF